MDNYINRFYHRRVEKLKTTKKRDRLLKKKTKTGYSIFEVGLLL